MVSTYHKMTYMYIHAVCCFDQSVSAQQIVIRVFCAEQDLLNSLPFVGQCPEDEVELLKFLYQNRLKKVSLTVSLLGCVHTSLPEQGVRLSRAVRDVH
jgi:hypothetical protein